MLLPTEVLVHDIENRISAHPEDDYETLYGRIAGLTHFKYSTGQHFFGWYMKGDPLACVRAEDNAPAIAETTWAIGLENAVYSTIHHFNISLKIDIDRFERMDREFECYGWSAEEIRKANMLLGFTLNLQKYLFWIVLAQTGSNKTIDFQANDIFFELGGVGHPISFFLEQAKQRQDEWTPFHHKFDDSLLRICSNRIRTHSHSSKATCHKLKQAIFTLSLAHWSIKQGKLIKDLKDCEDAKNAFLHQFESSPANREFHTTRKAFELECELLSRLTINPEIITQIAGSTLWVGNPYFILKILMDCTNYDTSKDIATHWAIGLMHAAQTAAESEFLMRFCAKYCIAALTQSKYLNALNSFPLSQALMPLYKWEENPSSKGKEADFKLFNMNTLYGVQNVSQSARMFSSLFFENHKARKDESLTSLDSEKSKQNRESRIMLRLLDDRFIKQRNGWLHTFMNKPMDLGFAKAKVSEYEHLYSPNRHKGIESIVDERLTGHELNKLILAADFNSLVEILALARYTEQLYENHLIDCDLLPHQLDQLTVISFEDFRNNCMKILNPNYDQNVCHNAGKSSPLKSLIRMFSSSNSTEEKIRVATFAETAKAFDSLSPQLYECIQHAAQSRIEF